MFGDNILIALYRFCLENHQKVVWGFICWLGKIDVLNLKERLNGENRKEGYYVEVGFSFKAEDENKRK